MKVRIKKFNVDMEVKTKGIELDVYDSTGKHLGDLVVSKAQVVWCPGRTTPAKGKKLKWEKFIAMMEKL
jgi:hypothetical protein